MSTVVHGSFWGVDKIQNGGRCHGNQGAINVMNVLFVKKKRGHFGRQ
jgi:hypothetical protein